MVLQPAQVAATVNAALSGMPVGICLHNLPPLITR